MKVENKTHKVVSDLGNNSVDFSIQDNGKLYQLLSTSVYSNKILAVCREYIANALDIHMTSGQTKPIEVTLPTHSNPVFIVEDYGTGIAHDQIAEIYMSYGNSTKDDSEHEIGGFGIGCKAAFAYSNNFTLQSVHSRKRTVYACAIDEDFKPEGHIISQEDSIEQTGIKISVPVSREDVHSFANEVRSVLQFVDPSKYSITADAIIIAQDELLYNDDIYNVYESDSNYNSSVILVVGGIGYIVDTDHDKVKNILKEYDFARNYFSYNSGWNSANYLKFHVNVTPSQAQVSLSRESLQYTKSTLNVIREFFDWVETSQNEIEKGIFTHLEDKQSDTFSKYSNTIKARRFLNPSAKRGQILADSELNELREDVREVVREIAPLCIEKGITNFFEFGSRRRNKHKLGHLRMIVDSIVRDISYGEKVENISISLSWGVGRKMPTIEELSWYSGQFCLFFPKKEENDLYDITDKIESYGFDARVFEIKKAPSQPKTDLNTFGIGALLWTGGQKSGHTSNFRNIRGESIEQIVETLDERNDKIAIIPLERGELNDIESIDIHRIIFNEGFEIEEFSILFLVETKANLRRLDDFKGFIKNKALQIVDLNDYTITKGELEKRVKEFCMHNIVINSVNDSDLRADVLEVFGIEDEKYRSFGTYLAAQIESMSKLKIDDLFDTESCHDFEERIRNEQKDAYLDKISKLSIEVMLNFFDRYYLERNGLITSDLDPQQLIEELKNA